MAAAARPKTKAKSRAVSYVYLAQTDNGKYMKVGTTGSLYQRFANLTATARRRFKSDVHYLYVAHGDRSLEALLLSKLSHFRLGHTEWMRSNRLAVTLFRQRKRVPWEQTGGFCKHGIYYCACHPDHPTGRIPVAFVV